MWSEDEPGGESESCTPEQDAFFLGEKPRFVLNQKRRQKLRSMPEYERCVIPSFLCGTPRSVLSKWKPIAKRLVRSGGFEEVLKGIEFVHIDDAPGDLIAAPSRGFSRTGSDVVLYDITTVLNDRIYKHLGTGSQRYAVRKRLIAEGLDHFWFCLCLMSGVGQF